ncbi:polysaccharide deacetylase domain-containing protein [Rhizobium etli bv. phaseoli str. IE4803]|nr:polysaccharide deacetylase domain-containing protein [Rhizobium etli bv. phaseoli str. IE4803]
MRDMVVMDVDIDSKDYFATTPVSVTQRTMDQLHKRGHGIILMHDIHKRTAKMLPTLLSTLEAEGYKVVTMKFKKTRPPNNLVASADFVMTRERGLSTRDRLPRSDRRQRKPVGT